MALSHEGYPLRHTLVEVKAHEECLNKPIKTLKLKLVNINKSSMKLPQL